MAQNSLKTRIALTVVRTRKRTVYVRNEHVPVWERAIQVAKDTDRALSDIIAEALSQYLADKRGH